MLADEAADGVLEVGDRAEDTTFEPPSGEDGEEALDGVNPRCGGRGEMEDPSRMVVEPLSDLRVLVSGIVVEDGVDHLAGRNSTLNGVEEGNELLMRVLRHAPAEDGAVEEVERSEQGGGAVAFIVVGHGATFARLERQARLGAVEGLDLALFVDRQDDRVSRRVHVQADNVFDLVSEGGVGGALEGADAVRLKAVGVPDALNGAQADTGGLGGHAAGPMGGLAGRFGAGQGQNPSDNFLRQRRPAGLARLVTQQPVDALFGKTLLPAPHRWPAGTGAGRHIEDRQSIRRVEDDTRPLDVLLRAVPVADDRGQARAIFGSQQSADGLSHTHDMVRASAIVDLSFASVH